MTSKRNLVKDSVRSESQPRGRLPSNLISLKGKQAYGIDHEGEDDCTVFSMRENLVRNATTLYQDRHIIQEQPRPRKKKKISRKANNNSALLDLDRSGYSHQHVNNSTRNISYHGNNSFVQNENMGYYGVPAHEKKPKIAIYRQDERHDSNRQLDLSAKMRTPTRHTAQSQHEFDEVGDDEPIFPMINRNRKTFNKQRHNISDVLMNEGNSFDYSSYKESKLHVLSTRPLSSYRNGIDLRLRSKIVSDQDHLSNRKIEKPGRYLDPIANDLSIYTGHHFEPGAFLPNNPSNNRPLSKANSRQAVNRSIGDQRTNKSSEGEFFPRLSIKNLEPENSRMNPYQSQTSVPSTKPVINPGSTRYSTRKSRNLSHLDITAPARSSSVQKETASATVSASKTSNLLKKITRQQNSSVKQDLAVKKNSTGNTSLNNVTTPVLKSNRSQKSSRVESNTTIKTSALKYSGIVLDSNRLVRGQYRVKNLSTLSLSARSERDLSGNSRSESPKLEKETSDKVILPDRQLENDKENKEQKTEGSPLESMKLSLNEKANSAGSQNMNTSARSIKVEQQGSIMKTSQAHDLGDRTISNLSFMQDSYLSGLSKRNRSMIDKFNKEWEDHKKKIGKGLLKEASFIKFQTPGHPLIPRSKGIAFERSRKEPLFSATSETPGPAKYKIQIPTRNNAYSFRNGTKFDITGLPLIEDVNRMMDQTRAARNASQA